MSYHEYTVKRVYHFTCGECQQPWSYPSDHVVTSRKQYRFWPYKDLRLHEMTCPHCGIKSIIMSKDIGKAKENV